MQEYTTISLIIIQYCTGGRRTQTQTRRLAGSNLVASSVRVASLHARRNVAPRN